MTTSRSQEEPENWSQLSPAEKRQKREEWFLHPHGVRFASREAAEAYAARAKRLIDVYNIREPDRVPVSFSYGSLPFKAAGVDFRAGMYDFEKAAHVYRWFNSKFADRLDSFAGLGMVPPGQVFELLDYKLYVWPGHGLPEKATGYQFVEGEYMRPDEYDDLILNPADFWTRVYLPRIFGALESFRKMDAVTDIIEMPIGPLMSLASPELQATLQKLITAGQTMQKRAALATSMNQEGIELGYPVTGGVFAKAPFDVIGDTLRGTQGVMMDMYRRPDKLLAAMDVVAGLLIKSAVAKSGRGLMVMFPLHKGADGWMSQQQFEKFYWPPLKKVINALVDEGLIVRLFAEGGYNTRLGSVNEFARGTVHWWFDQTDMARAKRILGDKCCLQGNVPSSLLMTGTPSEVKDHSRKLIETCGRGGGYILAPGVADVDATVENLSAMVDAAREYGKYR